MKDIAIGILLFAVVFFAVAILVRIIMIGNIMDFIPLFAGFLIGYLVSICD